MQGRGLSTLVILCIYADQLKMMFSVSFFHCLGLCLQASIDRQFHSVDNLGL